MEENNNSISGGFSPLGVHGMYTLRSTGEEVEVIDFYQTDRGSRSLQDWVSFIDSEGKEHIKESLSISFDFKAADTMAKAFEKLLTPSSFKVPDPWANRKYEIVKECAVSRNYSIGEAIKAANMIIEALKKRAGIH